MSGPQYTPAYRGTDVAAGMEFSALAEFLNRGVVFPPTYHAEPQPARRGLIVVADGVDWDPAALTTGEPYLVWFSGTVWKQLAEVVSGGGGVTDHGDLTGLSDPDHPIAAISGLSASLTNLQNQINANATAITGKVKTFRQASPPTATAIGDVWFDSDDGNHEYVWNGSAWISVRDLLTIQNEIDVAAAILAASSAQATADGKVTTYYSSTDPTQAPTFVVPGEGDLWFDTSTGNTAYRWEAGSSQWIPVQDQAIVQALSAAADAQSTADGKIQTFIQPSAPSGDVGFGDIWFDSDDNNHPYRYNGTSWISVRDQLVIIASNNAALAIINAALAQATADGKIVTFVGSSPPTAQVVGDIWFNTNTQRLWRWDGSAWIEFQDVGIVQAITDAATAQATADGKVTTFYQDNAPTAEGVGDIWVDTNDNNHPYRWSGSAWVTIQDGDVLVALANAATAISSAATAQATADGKIITFYQNTPPTAAAVGDLWIENDNGNMLYRWNGTIWLAVQDAQISSALTNAALAQATADGKIVTFYQTSQPTAEGVGDLWIDTDANDTAYRWNGASWDLITLANYEIDNSFTVTTIGLNPNQSGTMAWERVGERIKLTLLNQLANTSNSTSLNLSGLPSNLWPANFQVIPVIGMISNGITRLSGVVRMFTDGTLQLHLWNTTGDVVRWNTGNFVASGTKGVEQGLTWEYTLN